MKFIRHTGRTQLTVLLNKFSNILFKFLVTRGTLALWLKLWSVSSSMLRHTWMSSVQPSSEVFQCCGENAAFETLNQ